MALTIYDISKQAGVSIATVSRVLNGNTNVKASTREKVMKVIEENDYAPNAFARGMGLRSLHTIGLLCADSSDIFLAKAVYYIEQELQANGYESLLCCTGYDLDVKKKYLNLIMSKKVDALVLVGSNFVGINPEDNEYIREAAQQVPVMLLNAHYDCDNVYGILSDDYRSMFEVTTNMINSGLKDILYIYHSETFSSNKKRTGYSDAMKNGCDNSNDGMIYKYDGDIYDTDAVAAFIENIAKTTHFSAVLASEDALAIGALKYAYNNNISVPNELTIVGHNNSLLCTCANPALTSIDNRLETVSLQLVKTLMNVLAGEEMPKRTVYPGTLVKRETSLF